MPGLRYNLIHLFYLKLGKVSPQATEILHLQCTSSGMLANVKGNSNLARLSSWYAVLDASWMKAETIICPPPVLVIKRNN